MAEAVDVEQGNFGGSGAGGGNAGVDARNDAGGGAMIWTRFIGFVGNVTKMKHIMWFFAVILAIIFINNFVALQHLDQTSIGSASIPPHQTSPGVASVSPQQTSSGVPLVSPHQASSGVPLVSPHDKNSPKLDSDDDDDVDDDVDYDFESLGVPWCRSKTGQGVPWTTEDLVKGLEEFVPIYETRPITDETVMGFDHSFGLWFIARWLKPIAVVEYGGFRGFSTWVLRQALPETPIVFISPDHPDRYPDLGPFYIDKNCHYLTGVQFLEFRFVAWAVVLGNTLGVTDLTRVLLFFDDHENQMKKISSAIRYGFRHLVFDDNHDTGTGGHFSLRQLCDQFYIKGGGHSCLRFSDEAIIREKRKRFWENAVDRDELCGPDGEWWGVRGMMRDFSNSSYATFTLSQHFNFSRYVEYFLDLYWELPPVAGPSLTHQTRYDPARVSWPIIEDNENWLFEDLGLKRLNASVFNRYNQMVYVQLSHDGF